MGIFSEADVCGPVVALLFNLLVVGSFPDSDVLRPGRVFLGPEIFLPDVVWILGVLSWLLSVAAFVDCNLLALPEADLTVEDLPDVCASIWSLCTAVDLAVEVWFAAGSPVHFLLVMKSAFAVFTSGFSSDEDLRGPAAEPLLWISLLFGVGAFMSRDNEFLTMSRMSE